MRSCHPEMNSKGKSYKCTIANCRSKDKKWPRADNFRQHLKRVHRIQQPGDDDLEQYVYTVQSSPVPDLAGLGTSVGAGLVSLNINPDGLSSNPWGAYSSQSIQEQMPEDPCELNDYMDFQRRTLFAQEHIAMMSHARPHLPDNLMHIPSLELDAESPSTQLEPAHSQSQRLQDFTASSIGHHETDFEQSNFFNEASLSDHESAQDEQSVIHHNSREDITRAEDACEGPRAIENLSTESIAQSSADTAYHVPTHGAVPVEDKDSSIVSTSSASSTSGGDEFPRPSIETAASLAMQVTEPRLDVLEVIKDQDKAYDLILALKEKGLLAGLLEKVDYEKSADPEVQSTADALTRRDGGKNSHVCPRQDCKKPFQRQCELT